MWSRHLGSAVTWPCWFKQDLQAHGTHLLAILLQRWKPAGCQATCSFQAAYGPRWCQFTHRMADEHAAQGWGVGHLLGLLLQALEVASDGVAQAAIPHLSQQLHGDPQPRQHELHSSMVVVMV